MDRQKRGVLVVRIRGCSSVFLNKFLAPPLVAYLSICLVKFLVSTLNKLLIS